jgi:hypothetical protein
MDQANAFHTLSERLQHLEDLEEIRRLYIAYGRHLDDGNVAAYVALFSRDAKLRLGPVMRADGSAEIESAVTALLKSTSSARHRSTSAKTRRQASAYGLRFHSCPTVPRRCWSVATLMSSCERTAAGASRGAPGSLMSGPSASRTLGRPRLSG